MTPPAWTGHGITMRWFKNVDGDEDRDLFAGSIWVGHIDDFDNRGGWARTPWSAWTNIQADGVLIGRYATADEARAAVVDAAVKALFEEKVG